MTTLYTTGQALKQLVLSRAGDDATSPDFANEVETYLQTAYLAVVSAFPWPWARKEPPGVLNTVAEITTGTVTLTQGSTAGTFTSAPAASVAGRKIYTEVDGIVCRISAHTAGVAAFTLDAAYPGDGGSGLSYSVFQDEYDLAADFLAPWGKPFLRDCHGTYDLDLISAAELNAQFPNPYVSAETARYCALLSEKRLRIRPWPAEIRRYEYDYIYHPGVLTFDGTASTDTPIISPAEDRIILAQAACAELMVDMNDDRFAILAKDAPTTLERMKRLARRLMRGRLWMRSQYAIGTRR